MRKFITAMVLASALASPAFAAADKPTYEQLQEQVEYLQAALNGAIQQRDQAQAALANNALDAAAKSAAAQAKAARTEKKKD